jgi:hypothetical protein
MGYPSMICINLRCTGNMCLPKEFSWTQYSTPMLTILPTKSSQHAPPPLSSRSSLDRLPVTLVIGVRFTASSNDGGFSYGGGATTSVEGRAGKGAAVSSSSVLVRSARPRLVSLLQLTILAYNIEARKSRRMVPIVAPTMIPAYLPLDRYIGLIGGWRC